MDGNSLTPQQEKLNILKQLLPEAFSEEKIDWEKLKAALGEDINIANERYVLNWAGKNEAFKLLQKPSTKTLIPLRGESIDFDETQNIFIEGENLEVLKVLQKSYFGKVKTVYIDPPYNTGSDTFVYSDMFSETKAEYQKRVGDRTEDGVLTKGGVFRKNSKENGQYHSNWLSMMMPRLYLARNLMRSDGAIFVSIDDNEVHNLRLLLNEVFGEENFRNIFAVRRYDKNLNRQFIANGLKTFNVGFEYILCYAKSEEFCFNPVYKESSSERQSTGYWKGFWNDADRPTMRYDILGFTPQTGQWKWKKETALEAVRNYEVFLREHSHTKSLEEYWVETGKQLKFIRRNPGGQGKNKGVENWIAPSDGKLRNTNWTDLFASKHEPETQGLFDFPKNKEVISMLLDSSCGPDGLVLDFFAGSGTTAHAVMDLNKADGGKRKYICVQLAEPCNEKSAAKQAGFATIADLSRERIRRASKKIQQDVDAEIKKTETEIEIKKIRSRNPSENDKAKAEGLENRVAQLRAQDLGFKSFQLSDSNFKQWRNPEDKKPDSLADRAKYLSGQIQAFVDPVEEFATTENIAYELLLKSGKGLGSLPKPSEGGAENLSSAEFHMVNGGELILVLEKATAEIIEKIIAVKPQKVIVLDRLFKDNDQLKANTVLKMKNANIEFESL